MGFVMGLIRAFFWGTLVSFSMVSSVQALTFERSLTSEIDVVIGMNPGLKISRSFMGGTVKETLTIGELYMLYAGAKWAMHVGSRAVVNEYLGGKPKGYTFSDKVGKQVTSVIAAFYRDPELKRKLKEFYDIKQELNGNLTEEEKKELQRKCIVVKHTIKVLMA